MVEKLRTIRQRLRKYVFDLSKKRVKKCRQEDSFQTFYASIMSGLSEERRTFCPFQGHVPGELVHSGSGGRWNAFCDLDSDSAFHGNVGI